MNNVREKQYTLCLAIDEKTIPIIEKPLQELDNFTMQYKDKEELLIQLLSNDLLNTMDLIKNHHKLVREIITNGKPFEFVIEREINKAKPPLKLLYKKDKDFDMVRCYMFFILKTDKHYLDEVILTPYNRHILNDNSYERGILSTLDHLTESREAETGYERDLTTDRIKTYAEKINNSLIKRNTKIGKNYKVSRGQYLDSLKFLEAHQGYELDNPHDYGQLKPFEPSKRLEVETNNKRECYEQLTFGDNEGKNRAM